MLKVLLVVGLVLFAVVASVGGTLGAMQYLHHPDSVTPSSFSAKPPAKPIYFATLSDITVSIPPEADTAATSYVAFSVQLSTYEQSALVTFEEMEPIIKSAVITLLMNETSQSLQDPQTRVDLSNRCLHIANDVLARNAGYTPANPFTAAYITNLVVQD